MTEILIGDIVKVKHRSPSLDYVWNNKKLRVADIYPNYLVLHRQGEVGDYNICISINDIICHDTVITVYRGGEKWKLEYSQ